MMPTIVLFGKTIDLYNVFLYSGYGSVFVVLLSLKKHYKYGTKKAVFYSILTLLSGLIAAHLAAGITNFAIYHASGKSYNPHDTKDSYGLCLLIIFVLIFCILFRKEFRTISDYIAPCIPLVTAFVKVGCTLHGCCYSHPDSNGIYNVQLGYKTFPIQIYESSLAFATFAVCIILTFTFSKKHKGYIYPLVGIMYAAQRGWAENYRVWTIEWKGNFLNSGFTFCQYFLLFVFIGCIIWLIGNTVCDVKGVPDFDKAKIHLPDLSKPAKKATNFIEEKTKTLFGKIVEQILQK